MTIESGFVRLLKQADTGGANSTETDWEPQGLSAVHAQQLHRSQLEDDAMASPPFRMQIIQVEGREPSCLFSSRIKLLRRRLCLGRALVGNQGHLVH